MFHFLFWVGFWSMVVHALSLSVKILGGNSATSSHIPAWYVFADNLESFSGLFFHISTLIIAVALWNSSFSLIAAIIYIAFVMKLRSLLSGTKKQGDSDRKSGLGNRLFQTLLGLIVALVLLSPYLAVLFL